MTNTTETMTNAERLAREYFDDSKTGIDREARVHSATLSIAASNIAILDGIKVLISERGIYYKDAVEQRDQPITADEFVDVAKVEDAFSKRLNARSSAERGELALATRRLLLQIEAEDALNSTEFEMYEQKIREARNA